MNDNESMKSEEKFIAVRDKFREHNCFERWQRLEYQYDLAHEKCKSENDFVEFAVNCMTKETTITSLFRMHLDILEIKSGEHTAYRRVR